MKNFSFANQRFESEESPGRRICCTLMASMLFLTTEAEDPNRTTKERENASQILTVFNTSDLTLFGLESDLASDGADFLRQFDTKRPDPALTSRRLRVFIEKTKALYLDAKILHKPNTGSITSIVLKTLASVKATFF